MSKGRCAPERASVPRRAAAVLLVLALFLAPGCVLVRAHNNAPLDEAQIAAIERGVTTKAEVLERFGPPDQIENREFVLLGQPREKIPLERLVGSRFFVYKHTRANGWATILIIFNYFDGDVKSDRLAIFFDDEDVVEDFAFARDTDHLPRFGPFSR